LPVKNENRNLGLVNGNKCTVLRRLQPFAKIMTPARNFDE